MPPGRSDTVAPKRTRRRSAESPRSITRPNVLVSIFPPHSSTHTFFPLSLPNRGPSGNTAASAAAPPPSTTNFSISINRSIASAMSFSDTRHVSSTKCLATSNEVGPTTGTARPSAMVASLNPLTGLPAFIAAVYEATFSGSTPIILMLGLIVLQARDTPAINPAPPIGTRIASTSLTCSMISIPIEPAPAMISGSSYPLMYFFWG
mmetsp:Transcript_32809/g.55326  ORF Transcript_32809/g.55326 Transcript_32809/m.55326 type:complete len:206 (-) Transcript_32809:640-1257(-)